MRTVTYRLDDLKRVVIHIGKVAENEYTRVQIDAGDLFAELPNASAALTVQPPEGEAYPATVTRNGNFVIWDVKDSDLAADGDGEIQFTFTSGNVVKKSDTGRIVVCRSIIGDGEAPDPVQDWISDATAVLEAVENAIPEGGTTGQVLAKKTDADYDLEWVDQTGGGGGGTSDYNDLSNKPKIGGTTLSGNKSLADLGIAAASDVSAKYTKPGTGIPSTDLASAVQTSLGKADTAYQLPSGGMPKTDMASAVQTSLGKADTAYQLPSGGIPAADIASGVIPDPTSIIDDTAGDGATNKVWSADKLTDLQSALQGKLDEPTTAGTSGQVLTSDGSGGQSWQTPDPGTVDYTDLENKPSINSVPLSGNKSLSDLGIASVSDVSAKYTKPASGIPASDIADGVIPTISQQDVTDAVDDWLDANITNPDSPSLDRTLTSSSAAAPADIAGEISGGLSDLRAKFADVGVENKTIEGNASVFTNLFTFNILKGTTYTVTVKLNATVGNTVYIRLYDASGNLITDSGHSISSGNTFSSKNLTFATDYPGAKLAIRSSTTFNLDFAYVVALDGLIDQLAKGVTADDVTALTLNASNQKSIDGTGHEKSESDTAYYVSDYVAITEGHWYLISASAGYASSYYSIFDGNYNVISFMRSPSGSTTNLINKLIYAPARSRYIKVAYVTGKQAGAVALCNTLKANTSSLIDDSAGDGATGKTWSADKLTDQFGSVNNSITSNIGSILDANVSIMSLVGESGVKNKSVTGTGSYQPIIRMNLKANVQYIMNMKLKNTVSNKVYIIMQEADGTAIGTSSTIEIGDTYIIKSVTPTSDYINASFSASCAVDYEIEYANLFSLDNIIRDIARIGTGDDMTMLSFTSSNKKSINGNGAITTETDTSYYVTEDIEIKPSHWYMVTASAGYSHGYYAILDANSNPIYVEKSPSGASTALVNRLIYTPLQSKYIRIAYVSTVSGGHIALCNTIKAKETTAPEWWNKFLAISYSDIGVAHTNSLETYISAGHFGFPVCKGDVQPTSDDKLIMCHDAGFTFDGNDRITTYNASSNTPIHSISHETAMTYEYAGMATATENNHYQKVTDIDGYLDVCKQYGMIAFITIRDTYIDTVCTEVVSALKRHGMLNRAIINSYTPEALSYIRFICDNIPISFVQSDNYSLSAGRVTAISSYNNAAITLVSTPENMRTYLSGLSSTIASAISKNVMIMYAQPKTMEDVYWLRSHNINGAQIGKPCMPYQFSQIRFKVDIDDSTASLVEWNDLNTMEATVSQSSNVISVSVFKVAGSDRGFADLIMEYWMNKFPYRITATSENGNAVTAVWQNNALKLTVNDISTDDTIDVIIEV